MTTELYSFLITSGAENIEPYCINNNITVYINNQSNQKQQSPTEERKARKMCIPCCYTVSTSEVGVVEKWGKFNRLSQPGLGYVLCPMEQLVGRLSFRVQQIDVRVETKTLDNVFLTAVVSVQYQVLRENVFEAFYALTNPAQQIT